MQGMPESPTLYLDRMGSVHFDLKDALKRPVRAARSPRPQERTLALTGIFAYSEPGKGWVPSSLLICCEGMGAKITSAAVMNGCCLATLVLHP